VGRGAGAAPILDAGCGTGGFLAQLAAHYPNRTLFGLDADPLACRRTAAKGARPVCVGSINQPLLLQLHYRAFDAAMGCSAPAPRFGSLALAVGAACGLSLHVVGVTKHRFSRSIRKPGRASRRAMPADLRGALGERFLRAGTTGSGQAATALADFLRGVEMLAASEALRIGSALVSKPERCWR